MFKYTTHTLKKMESLFNELGYVIRYEKGNFNSGYCIVKDSKVVVINKFYDTEARINCFLEILNDIIVDVDQLPAKDLKFFVQLTKKELVGLQKENQ